MKIYVTFGQQYRYKKHPVDERAHPDGYFEFDIPENIVTDIILTDQFNLLYKFISDKVGYCFSNFYTDSTFDKSFYPLGKLNTNDHFCYIFEENVNKTSLL
jgi:hypothetical protein